ncbi:MULTISPECIES: zinc-binding dehydrogenase [Cryobacterium]|uniref:Alcohol dehydrogenase n=1 Tax=Cryobacterium glucosi TaxID=1259175 RepID=A0ABY2ILP0_9MICO|nr:MULTISPECIES: zinc-binding dehydrogenase [Cryobacterium]TFB92972.1 alcohol dehydrogenase [Cryobacterium sp. MDB2-A-1]TFC05852.1 alcohol dehydrogenase [Cryobacterium sp. MDB2-33-2]TFC10612.1 alcohol dehydrogenase [Cryobacterium sp. MDB2-A-2]TFC17298.1 alcohol dehydrogenase [Cryobacterium glucosi]TFC21581.1 alcohol dehydrogenase [Cryobacterium sp. MDB2-10]
MKALRFAEQNVPRIDELPIPAIGADEVLVAARSVGVCHSDIDLLEGRYIIPFEYPIIPGHEWSGEVVAVGNRVQDFAAGDRVVGECVIGEDHFGFSISGAAAEFFVARPEWLHKLPASVSYTNGALVEPFSVAYYALMRVGNVNASDTLVVLGAGPIGLAVTAAASALGAVTIVVEPSPERRDAALRLGASHAVHPDDIVEFLNEQTDGRGADVVVEASGRPAVMAQALELAAFRGRVAYIGIDVGREAPAKLGLIQSKELKITGSVGSPGVWPETLRFLAHTGIDLSPLVTQRFGAADALGALEAAHHPATTIKAHIEFDAVLPA